MGFPPPPTALKSRLFGVLIKFSIEYAEKVSVICFQSSPQSVGIRGGSRLVALSTTSV